MFDQPLIQFIEIEKSFLGKRPVLSNINLEISRGEILFLTGISGAGKSTVLRLIMGLESPNKGRVLYNGYNVHQLSKKKYPNHLRSIGMVFQDYKLLSNKTAKENIGIPLQIKGIGGIRAEKRVVEIAHHAGIGHLLEQPIKCLSGGEQQLIAIARAAVHEPLLILADEPTANLDPTTALKIIRILKQLNEKGITVVIATHDMHVLKTQKNRKNRTILIKNASFITIQ